MNSFHFRAPSARWLGRTFAFVSLLALSSACTWAATTYYVATTGNDANAGTIAAPFASITRAQTAAVAGDTVLVRGGTYTTFTIAATDANYNYVHRLNKSGLNWSAYPGETPIFDFSSVPTNLRVCGFQVTGSALTITGFVVTGVKDGTQKQSECFRIDGSAAFVDFYDCVAHDNAANGFYFTNHARGSCNRCDSYNNIGTNGDSIGNTDGFGAHGDGTVFRYCRSWNNSDDGYDCISATGSNTFDHCWAYNMKAGGDSNGFKVGGYGSGTVPTTVPVHSVLYCLSANNNAHGFYANHQPGQAAVWTHNTAYNHSAGNFDMLERVSPADITDIPGFRELLHFNVSFAGTIIKDDANPPASVTDNSWTNGATVTSADFLSVDATQMIGPRSAGNNLPFITFMHLAPGSDLAGLGCFDPPPAAPINLQAAWINSGRIDLTWSASAGATEYYVRRSLTSGGPYTSIAVRLSGTSFSDTTVAGGTTYYYQVSAMNGISFDEGVSGEAAATIPPVAITAITTDSGLSTTDHVTNDSTLVLTGTAGTGTTVTISRLGAGNVGTAATDGTGTWTFDYTATTLPEGTHTFQATVTDAGTGTSFTSDPFVVTVDLTPPAAPVINSVGSAGGSLVIGGTAEPGGQVLVTLDGSIAAGGAIAAADGTWSVTYAAALPADAHALVAAETDVAGNLGDASTPFLFDTRVVTPAITAAQSDFGALSNGALTRDKTLSFSGTAGSGNTVTITRVGTGVVGSAIADSGTWSFDYTATTLAEGANSFTATSSNGSGTSLSSPLFTITVDSVVPSVTSILRQSPASATVTSAVTSLVYRATFSEPVSGVDSSDFSLTTTASAAGTIASVAAVGGAIFDVTVNNLAGAGTLRLDLNAGTDITDVAGNAVAGFTAGQTYTRVVSTTGNGTWIQPASGGLWSDASNWLDAVIPSASTHSANFNTLDLIALNIVHLDSARTINSATFGDINSATPASWFLDNNGLAANTLTLAGTVPTITVNALGTDATATIGARLAGTGGFTKAGAGTLVLSGPNSLTGALSTTGGVLRLGPGGSLSHTTVGVGTGSQLDVNGGSLTASGTTTITGAANTVLVVNDGGATLATVTFTAADGGLFLVNGGNVTASTVTIPRSTDATIRYTTGFVVTGGNSTVTGAINLGTGNSNGVMSIEGGGLTVGGVITVGNQITATRGGAMRVIGGNFTSTNTASGIVLSRTNGANANNVSFATFSGGVSLVEKFTLGFDSTVTAGAATITLDGGELYLGSGGIVKNGTAGMSTAVNLTSGSLGAKANWSTTHPVTLTTGGNVNLKTADASNSPFNITLGGIVSGQGSLTKIGAGTLTLSAANTFTGSATVNAGTLDVTGSLAGGGSVTVNNTATLAGAGTINKGITLNAGGTIAPGNSAGTLTGAALTWNGGGTLAFDLGTAADQLSLSGAFTRGTAGTYAFAFTPGAGVAADSVYTLVSFASTTFTPADFSFTGLPAGLTGVFSIVANTLRFTVLGPPSITSALTATGVYGQPFNYTIVASGLPTSFDASSLPMGLTIDPTTGLISGTPLATGTFNVTLSATNNAGTGTAPLALSISKATASISFGNLSATYDGAAHAVSATTIPPGLVVGLTYNGSSTAPTNVGSYTVVATINDTRYAGTASATLVIAKKTATVTLANLHQFYDGSARSVTATTDPVGLNVALTYDGNANAPTVPGSYTVVGIIDDSNYSGTASGVEVITVTALVRHAPFVVGALDGSVQMLSGETVSLGGHAWISGDLLVPGTPTVELNGTPTYGGTLDGAGATSPTGFSVALNDTALLRHVVRRTDPIPLPVVDAPPAPSGTRIVSLTNSTQSAGDFTTLRNLSLNASAGAVAVPPGTYGSFSASGNSAFVLGVQGATDPAVYNFQSLSLNALPGIAQIQVVGPVIVTLANGALINGTTGSPAHPEWLLINFSTGGITISGNVTVNGNVVAPNGTVTLNGNATLNGTVIADRFTINGTSVLNDPNQ